MNGLLCVHILYICVRACEMLQAGSAVTGHKVGSSTKATPAPRACPPCGCLGLCPSFGSCGSYVMEKDGLYSVCYLGSQAAIP